MRAWLYDTLVSLPGLQEIWGDGDPVAGAVALASRVVPRESQDTINLVKPFIVYGLGNATTEGLSDSTDPDVVDPERQFSQIWIHDEGGDYGLIDSIIPIIKRGLVGQGSPEHNVLTTRYLETSQEFANETYGTILRYIRFQHIIAQGVLIT